MTVTIHATLENYANQLFLAVPSPVPSVPITQSERILDLTILVSTMQSYDSLMIDLFHNFFNHLHNDM